MEKIVIKYFWVLNIMTLLIVAYFLASGTSQVVASKLQAMLPAPRALQAAPKKKNPYIHSRSLVPPNGDAILSRNIFDSETGPVSRVEEVLTSDLTELQPVESGMLPLVPCTDGQVKLFSLVASKEEVDWSFASVEEGGKTRMLRVGDEAASRTVSGITWRYLFLRGSSDECYVDMFPDPNAPVPPPAAAAAAPAEPGQEGGYADRITKKSDTEAEVDRSVIAELLADPTKFIRSVRVRPQREGGKVVGYKLRRFEANSPLALLGAQRGDVIHAVNGADLTSVDKALGAYQSMRSANDLTFSITRAGKPMELKISIR